MIKLIGVCGEARHGKDTIAGIISELYDYRRIAFADKLKEIALAIDPYVVIHTRNDGMRIERLKKIVGESGWDDAKEHPDVRRLLQRIGTEAGREAIDENIWVNLLDKEASKYDRVVISDLRFPGNEVNYVRRKGGMIIKVFRPGLENPNIDSKHASEAQINLIQEDYLVINDATISDLKTKICPLVDLYDPGFTYV